MAKNGKQTSKKVAATASKILRDARYGKAAISCRKCFSTDQTRQEIILPTDRRRRT